MTKKIVIKSVTADFAANVDQYRADVAADLDTLRGSPDLVDVVSVLEAVLARQDAILELIGKDTKLKDKKSKK